jgi:hypothetical protein
MLLNKLRTEILVLGADDPNQKTIGFTIKETIGFSMINMRGIKRYYYYMCC